MYCPVSWKRRQEADLGEAGPRAPQHGRDPLALSLFFSGRPTDLGALTFLSVPQLSGQDALPETLSGVGPDGLHPFCS